MHLNRLVTKESSFPRNTRPSSVDQEHELARLQSSGRKHRGDGQQEHGSLLHISNGNEILKRFLRSMQWKTPRLLSRTVPKSVSGSYPET